MRARVILIFDIDGWRQAQVSLLAFYGRGYRPARRVGVQYRGAPATGVPLVSMGNGTLWDLARHLVWSRTVMLSRAPYPLGAHAVG